VKTIKEESHRHVSESSYYSSVGNRALGRMGLVKWEYFGHRWAIQYVVWKVLSNQKAVTNITNLENLAISFVDSIRCYHLRLGLHCIWLFSNHWQMLQSPQLLGVFHWIIETGGICIKGFLFFPSHLIKVLSLKLPYALCSLCTTIFLSFMCQGSG
jgi:hypothetical protein